MRSRNLKSIPTQVSVAFLYHKKIEVFINVIFLRTVVKYQDKFIEFNYDTYFMR